MDHTDTLLIIRKFSLVLLGGRGKIIIKAGPYSSAIYAKLSKDEQNNVCKIKVSWFIQDRHTGKQIHKKKNQHSKIND